MSTFNNRSGLGLALLVIKNVILRKPMIVFTVIAGGCVVIRCKSCGTEARLEVDK